MLKKVLYKKKLLAIIVQEKSFFKPGVNFVTPNNLPLQLGFMKHKSRTYIKPHTHKNHLRKIKKTTEILLIKRGSLRVDFYSKKKYLFSKIINKGKILILLEGSHGFKILKNCSMLEIKQGPFNLAMDKERFDKVNEKYIKIRK
jgi:hypothetical protein|tara:strand:- start:123 stop:554 length:432 start_codon:yes stop_codon:yes gene_type:complete